MDVADQIIEKVEALRAARHDGAVDLVEVLQAGTAIEDLVDDLVRPLVGSAVHLLRSPEFGLSWAEIGEKLGVSRQAAWERLHKYEKAGHPAVSRGRALRPEDASPSPAAGFDSMPAERLATFDFTVGRAFLDPKGGHPITIPQELRSTVIEAVGDLCHDHRSVTVVSLTGEQMEGTIRHSVNNSGDYLQLQCRDPEMAKDVSLGQVIRVELRRDKHGLAFWLVPPRPE